MAVADTVAPETPTEDAVATKEGTLVGTLSYLAPEQARGRDVGPRSDQFALATSAYEALVGRLPWDGGNAAVVLAQILVDDAPPPSSLDAALTPAVDACSPARSPRSPRAASTSARRRAIAARYATGGPRLRSAGEYLRARVEISEGRFGRAHERMSAALSELARFERLVDGTSTACTGTSSSRACSIASARAPTRWCAAWCWPSRIGS